MIKGNISKIETMGTLDGPGIRTVIFLGGCKLRCKYCHNPEMWQIKDLNYTPQQLVKKILNYKPYYNNTGGVTFSGGEPLIQKEFLMECCKLLKKENINIALDTSGVGDNSYQEILKYIDLVLLDIKHVDKEIYKDITGKNIEESKKFIEILKQTNKKIWIRQVIVPGIHDNIEYIKKLSIYLKTIPNIERIDFLPYHKLGDTKYTNLNMENYYLNKEPMDKIKCDKLYKEFIKIYNN